jgi:hypothetical protein
MQMPDVYHHPLLPCNGFIEISNPSGVDCDGQSTEVQKWGFGLLNRRFRAGRQVWHHGRYTPQPRRRGLGVMLSNACLLIIVFMLILSTLPISRPANIFGGNRASRLEPCSTGRLNLACWAVLQFKGRICFPLLSNDRGNGGYQLLSRSYYLTH